MQEIHYDLEHECKYLKKVKKIYIQEIPNNNSLLYKHFRNASENFWKDISSRNGGIPILA